jgi:hypothetical protein
MNTITFPIATAPEAPETPDHGKIIRAELTFPAIPAVYAANDAIGDGFIEFPRCSKIDGGAGLIVHLDMITEVVAATALVAELWLFNQEPTTQFDNLPFTKSNEDLSHLVAVLALGDSKFESEEEGGYEGYPFYGVYATVTASSCCGISRAFRCMSGHKSLWGVLVARSAYTPAANERLKLNLHIVQG